MGEGGFLSLGRVGLQGPPPYTFLDPRLHIIIEIVMSHRAEILYTELHMKYVYIYSYRSRGG